MNKQLIKIHQQIIALVDTELEASQPLLGTSEGAEHMARAGGLLKAATLITNTF